MSTPNSYVNNIDISEHVTLSHLSCSSELETPQYDVTIIGGYLDERETSERITASVLEVLTSSQAVFRLVAAVTGEVNTEWRRGVAWPRLYGAGVSVSTGQVFPARFCYHGPDPDIRSVKHWDLV